jgi:cytochrome c peroxidase
VLSVKRVKRRIATVYQLSFSQRVMAATCLIGVAFLVSQSGLHAQVLTPIEQLGKNIFFDQRLSINQNQSCAACHGPAVGWTGPIGAINADGAVYEGSIPGRFGDRKPPSSAYATQSPVLHFQSKGELWLGGNFWDGRATGAKLGNPAADQAQGPFLNPAEQALRDSACVVYRVCTANYPQVSLESVWGVGACTIAWPAGIETACGTEGPPLSLSTADRAKSDSAYDAIGLSVAAYEASPEVNAFTSKYDLSFKGVAKLTQTERRGFALFVGKGKCSRCHPATGPGALFTDFSYDNLGVPKNPANPVYASVPGFVDLGLGGFLHNAGYPAARYQAELGKVKVPTLRNVDKRPDPAFVKAFGHNGYFKSLKQIVHFYNTRDVLPTCALGDPGEGVTCWPPPEYPGNVNREELGDLRLSSDEEDAIVEFLKALSDGHLP